MRKVFFYTLVQTVVLDGCQVWGGGLAKEMRKKVERTQRRYLMEELEVKVEKLILFFSLKHEFFLWYAF